MIMIFANSVVLYYVANELYFQVDAHMAKYELEY